jgi:hypothetical protein
MAAFRQVVMPRAATMLAKAARLGEASAGFRPEPLS